MAHLLIVDDEENLRAHYEQEFRDLGYRVTGVSNGHDALQRIKDARPDLVILDIAMPGMDGIELLNQIFACDKTIPVVLNTAYPNHKDNFMTWSANAYVVKSGDLSELIEKVRELLSEAKLDSVEPGGGTGEQTKERMVESPL